MHHEVGDEPLMAGLCSPFEASSGNQEQSICYTRLRCIISEYFLFIEVQENPHGRAKSSQISKRVNMLMCFIDHHISVKDQVRMLVIWMPRNLKQATFSTVTPLRVCSPTCFL